MAAIFYTYSGKDVFNGHVSYKTPVDVSILGSVFDKPGNLSIVTEFGISTSETIQYFMSFDDVISFLHFGKGLGSISIGGIAFSDCSGDMPGLPAFYSSIGKLRGQVISVSAGNVVFKGVVTTTQVNIVSEPDTMAQFNLTLAMIDHSLALTPKQQSCSSSSAASSNSTGSGSTNNSALPSSANGAGGLGTGATTGDFGAAAASQTAALNNSVSPAAAQSQANSGAFAQSSVTAVIASSNLTALGQYGYGPGW